MRWLINLCIFVALGYAVGMILAGAATGVFGAVVGLIVALTVMSPFSSRHRL